VASQQSNEINSTPDSNGQSETASLSTTAPVNSSNLSFTHQPRTMAIRTALKQDTVSINAVSNSGDAAMIVSSSTTIGAFVSLASTLGEKEDSTNHKIRIEETYDHVSDNLPNTNSTNDVSLPMIATAAETQTSSYESSLSSHDDINNQVQATYTIPQAGQFSALPAHVCLHLMKCFITHLPTAYALSKTCKFWNALFNDDSIFRQAAAARFHLDTAELQIRLLHESLETSWKDVYQRLDEGRTSWKGFAIDRATNNFLPYPMEVIIGKTNRTLDKRNKHQHILKTDFDGMCRWESLRNSLTKVIQGC
jgi:hypothetical protein